MNLKVDKYSLAIVLGLVIVVIWGTSFLCSKVLVVNGMQPNEVYFLRAFISYVCLLALCHNRLFADNVKDELKLASLGIFGGTLYYILENTALEYSYTTNVSLIVSASPLITTFISLLLWKKQLSAKFWIGVVLAVTGLVLLISNGNFSYTVRLFGDLIAFCASFCWALYAVLVKTIPSKYSVLFMTRKVFFYGVLFVIPTFLYTPFTYPVSQIFTFSVLFNLLYLALLSSFLCFVVWNFVIRQIGAMKAANLVYLSPVFTFIASYFLLSEPLTVYSVVGSMLVLYGVYLSERDK